MVEKITHENEIAGSNPAGRVASEKCHDLGQERMGNDRWGLPPLRKKLFAIFRDFIAVYMFPLSWVKAAHGKDFVVCPKKVHGKLLFTSSYMPRELCHVPVAHGKYVDSRSDGWKGDRGA